MFLCFRCNVVIDITKEVFVNIVYPIKDKEKIDLIKNEYFKYKSKQALTDDCEKLKIAFFDAEYDISRFLDDYPQFW